MLHGIEDRRYRLRFVHENELSSLVRWQGSADIQKGSGVSQVLCSCLRISQVNDQRLGRQQRPEQRGLARLARPENQVDIGSRQLLLQRSGIPTVKHIPLYNQTINLKSSSEGD